MDHVVGEPKWHQLWDFERFALIEQTIEIDVDDVAVHGIEQYVLAMPITEAQDVADYRHNSCGSNVGAAGLIPVVRRCKSFLEPLEEKEAFIECYLKFFGEAVISHPSPHL